jgi:hypothetical protein
MKNRFYTWRRMREKETRRCEGNKTQTEWKEKGKRVEDKINKIK